MLSLILVIVFFAIAYFYGDKLRKSFTITTILLSLIAVLATIFNEFPLLKPFYQGFVGLALLYLVMMTGAINQKTKIRKKLNLVRKEYSIYGFIALTPHALKYLIAWFVGEESFEWWGVIAFLIMVPLFITSFYIIRKKMTPKAWKRLQSFAYLVYILLFIHLFLRYTEPVNLILFSSMSIVYLALKIRYEWNLFQQKTKTKL